MSLRALLHTSFNVVPASCTSPGVNGIFDVDVVRCDAVQRPGERWAVDLAQRKEMPRFYLIDP